MTKNGRWRKVVSAVTTSCIWTSSIKVTCNNCYRKAKAVELYYLPGVNSLLKFLFLKCILLMKAILCFRAMTGLVNFPREGIFSKHFSLQIFEC